MGASPSNQRERRESRSERHERRRHRREEAAAAAAGGAGGTAAAASQQQQQQQQQFRPPPPQIGGQSPYPTMYMTGAGGGVPPGAFMDPRHRQFLLQYQQMMQPRPIPQLQQQTTTVKNLTNLKKATLKIISQGSDTFLVSFRFDGMVDAIQSNYPRPPPTPRLFPAGMNQEYLQTSDEGLTLAILSSKQKEDLLKAPEGGGAAVGGGGIVFPLIIELKAAEYALEAETNQVVSLQLSYLHFTREEGGFGVKVIKQKIKSGTSFYELQSIYGITGGGGGGSGTSSGGEGGGGGAETKECVICLSAPPDTTVFPCRHMCMCIDCAKVLRLQTDKCPICRTPVESIVQIHTAQPAPPPSQGAATTSAPPPPGYQTYGGGGGNVSAAPPPVPPTQYNTSY